MSNPSLHGNITIHSRRKGKAQDENIKKSIEISSSGESPLVQSAYHNVVQFQGTKLKDLPLHEQKAYQYILDHCIIPDDFLLRKEYGALSGVSYEERLLAAYSSGLLKKNSTNTKSSPPDHTHNKEKSIEAILSIDSPAMIWPTPVCTKCGECEKHWKQDCPSYFSK